MIVCVRACVTLSLSRGKGFRCQKIVEKKSESKMSFNCYKVAAAVAATHTLDRLCYNETQVKKSWTNKQTNKQRWTEKEEG
jgi:hypothetical protein